MRARSRTSTSVSPTRTRTRGMSVNYHSKLVLNLRAPRPSLESLPSELLFTIIQYASFPPPGEEKPKSPLPSHVKRKEGLGFFESEHKSLDFRTLCALSLTSRTLSSHALTILYRAVTISTSATAELFSRTVTSKLTSLPNPGSLVTRLILSPSDFDPSTLSMFRSKPESYPLRLQMRKIDYYVSAVKLLGMEGNESVSPIFPILPPSEPVKTVFNPPSLDSLRTLIVDSVVLQRYIGYSTQGASMNVISSPTEDSPSLSFSSLNELIISTLLPDSSYLSPMRSSSLSRLFPFVSHLIITSHPGRRCSLKTTITLLGNLPNLTHIALVRRANSNEDNDMELVEDIQELMNDEKRKGILKQVVAGVVTDSDFAYWFEEQSRQKEKMPGVLESEIQAKEAYLSTTHLWTELDKLAQCTSLTGESISRKREEQPLLCVVPAREDGWARALRNGSEPTSVFENNVFGTFDGRRQVGAEKDLWQWARGYEYKRRRRAMQSSSSLEI